MFSMEMNDLEFSWEMLGDVAVGRENLGNQMPVVVYRLFEYTMKTTLTRELGKERAIDIFRKTGELAGREFAKNVLDLSLGLDQFVLHLQTAMRDLKMGILRFEDFDAETGKAVLTVAEDLDCSGLPVYGETVCNYDEGLIAGILSEYTGKDYVATEIDCWAKGDRVCRFEAKVKES